MHYYELLSFSRLNLSVMLKTIVEEMTGMFAFLQETKIRFNFHLMYDIREDVDGVVQVGSLQ